MGQRANLIVVERGVTDVYYTHHRANTLDEDLFWGPEYALGFIRDQRKSEDGELLDDVWAEGGAVMDVDRRSLLWFGGEDICCDVTLRRVHGKLMARVWTGWIINWAEGGVADLADKIGVPRTAVLSSIKEPPLHPPGLRSPIVREVDPDMSHTVASVRGESGEVHLALLHGPFSDLLYCGIDLTRATQQSLTEVALSLDWEHETSQDDGFHIDLQEKTIDFWNTAPTRSADILRRVQSCWPGWVCRWHGDRFESQLELAGGSLRIELPNRSVLLARLREILLRPDDPNRPSGAEAILSTARAITGQTDMTITAINPLALFDARLSIPLETRTKLFDAAVAAAGE